MGSCREVVRRPERAPAPSPPPAAAHVPRASTARMHCCTKRGTGLLSRSHSVASAQPNTWSAGEAGQRAPRAPRARSPGPSGTFDVALLPQRLQRGPLEQELEELLPDLAQVALLDPGAQDRSGCRGQCKGESVRGAGVAQQAPSGSPPPPKDSLHPTPHAPIPAHTCSRPCLILPPASQALAGPEVHTAVLAFLLRGQVCRLEPQSLRQSLAGLVTPDPTKFTLPLTRIIPLISTMGAQNIHLS